MALSNMNIRYWLVSHPTILNFHWKQGQTFGSSPAFLVSSVISYLSLTFILYRAHISPLSPKLLKTITRIHNIILLSISLLMATGCFISIVLTSADFHSVICFPKDISPSGPLFFWAYVFYLSKIVEFIDTFLIILSNSPKRLTFLHIYHHATVVVMCYVCVHTSQSSFPVVIVTNSMVHVVMYTYYLLCSLGVRPKWKRLVTDFQILQFISSFIDLALILYYHFTGAGCAGIWSWCFSIAFITSLLYLFLDFHSKSYSAEKKGY